MRISIEEASRLLKEGKVVAISTETVYGLASWLYAEKGVLEIFSLKRRPQENPLIIHVKNIEQCRLFLTVIPPDFDRLTQKFWPGALTLVLPIKPELIPSIARAGLSTAAFRMPNHHLCQAILSKVSPIVAPSANLSGKPSSTRPEHIEHDFGSQFPVVDGGIAAHGVESTILSFSEGKWHLARRGAICPEAIAHVLGYLPQEKSVGGDKPICPGQIFAHYAPKAKLILSNEIYRESEKEPIVLGFEDRKYPGAKRIYYFGNSASAEITANRLYDALRILDTEGVERVFVDMNFPENGLWETIKERLTKAAGSKIN